MFLSSMQLPQSILHQSFSSIKLVTSLDPKALENLQWDRWWVGSASPQKFNNHQWSTITEGLVLPMVPNSSAQTQLTRLLWHPAEQSASNKCNLQNDPETRWFAKETSTMKNDLHLHLCWKFHQTSSVIPHPSNPSNPNRTCGTCAMGTCQAMNHDILAIRQSGTCCHNKAPPSAVVAGQSNSTNTCQDLLVSYQDS